jgi:hypothetical protein
LLQAAPARQIVADAVDELATSSDVGNRKPTAFMQGSFSRIELRFDRAFQIIFLLSSVNILCASGTIGGAAFLSKYMAH